MPTEKFKGGGVGTHKATPPISVKLPPEIDKAVRAMGTSKADWLRQVITDAITKEGRLPDLVGTSEG